MDIVDRVAAQVGLPARGVRAVVDLLSGGATVPFVARYRKEATGALDEVQIRAIRERHASLLALEERRESILESLAERGLLTDALGAAIAACATRAELEDVYLPYRPKRRTRATVARERGLLPLALRILEQPSSGSPRAEAGAFVDPARDVPDADAALAGARDIVAEVVAEDAAVRALVRRAMREDGSLVSALARGKGKEPTKFERYYAFRETVRTVPSHRVLAIARGEREGILRAGIEVDSVRLRPAIADRRGLRATSPWAAELRLAIEDSLERLLGPSLDTEVRGEMEDRAHRAAADVFADNLRALLLAAPLGPRPVVGIDPGLRTGCKCAALDATGTFLETVTIYPSHGDEASGRARRDLAAFLAKHRPAAVAVGNGTAGRETEAFVRETLAAEGLAEILVVSVSEAGASVYSASDVAREELPDLDLTIRGAISIGRRLQDPLAELVKIDPRSIGVGQYQHDVPPVLLEEKLDAVVESCVNAVGVEVNTASAPLLARVAGIGPVLAGKIVKHREGGGGFRSRRAIAKVKGFGPRAFEQAAGFLRIRGGEHPLDASAVHPERYALVERMAGDLGAPLAKLVGDPVLASRIDAARWVGGDVGEPTIRDILAELGKPGRDPRSAFAPPRFREDVTTLEDLRPGMVLEGVVTNVTAFGAFVDVGVHQDGLVHVSQLADRFVKDPREVVSAGARIEVHVLEVDLARKRISLSAKKKAPPA